jgi:hypothetical protein
MEFGGGVGYKQTWYNDLKQTDPFAMVDSCEVGRVGVRGRAQAITRQPPKSKYERSDT